MTLFSRAPCHILALVCLGLIRDSRCADLLPMGSQAYIEDESLKIVALGRPLKFFEREHSIIYISDDGVIVFDGNMEGSTDKPKKFPFDKSIIAPLWHDFDGATVYQNEISLEDVGSQNQDLDLASDLVRKTHPGDFDTFKAVWAMVITWYNVTLYDDEYGKLHTFQLVLTAADNNATFAIFLYANVQNAAYAQIGVNAGHCDLYYSLCISLTSETKNLMNLRPCDGDYGMVGFRIDMVDRDQSFYMCTPTYAKDSSQCECSNLDLPTGEIMVKDNRTKVGDLLTYTCQPGYVMVGDDMVACWYNGTSALWDGSEHSCKKRPVWTTPPQGDYDRKEIPEDLLPDSLVYTLKATTGDGGDNITYSFLKQTPDKPVLFDLSENLVKVLPDAELDIDAKDKPTMYILHFSANDGRYRVSNRVATDTFLIVNIKDVNDNAPKFSRYNYTATIEASKSIGSSVLQVSAYDKDFSAPYNMVRYEIMDQDHPGYFSLGAWDGFIKLLKKPEYSSYQMTIQASDGGGRFYSKMDNTRVYIFVDGVVKPTTPQPSSQTKAKESNGSSMEIALIVIVVIVVLVIIGVAGFVFRRRLKFLLSPPNVSASFKTGSANVSIENPGIITNANYVDDNNSFRPGNSNSTNECQPGTEHDSHYDTDVLTMESWQKEKERVKF